MLYDLYRYDDWHDLLYDNGVLNCECTITDNRNMNERNIKLHKGVDNEVKFRVFDSNRKRTRIDHLRIDVTLINQENREISFKTTAKNAPERGVFVVRVNEGDLVNMSPGYYDFVITGQTWAVPEQPGEIVSTPFYSDLSANMLMTAEVTTQAQKLPVPTTTIYSKNPTTGLSDWICTDEIVDNVFSRVYHSSPIPANRLKNQKRGTHTFAAQFEEFTGRFQVRGSLDHVPPTEANSYFPLNLTSFRDFVQYGSLDPAHPNAGIYLPYSGVDAYTFNANVLWIMFVWIPTDDKGVPLDENVFNTAKFVEPVTRVQVRS